MALMGGYGLGSIVTFRYTSPKSHDRSPMVLVLTDRHRDGYMHGLNLRYLTPLQQQQLQYFFRTPFERVRDFINPFKQKQIQQYQQELERRRQQMQQQNQPQEQEGYIVRPEPGNIFGVSTFVKSVGAVIQQVRGAFGRLRRYLPFGGQEEPQKDSCYK